MTEAEALQLITSALTKVLNKPMSVTRDSDLVAEEILDSLDGMVFLLELEQATGLKFPEEGDLVAQGYFSVPKLIQLFTHQ